MDENFYLRSNLLIQRSTFGDRLPMKTNMAASLLTVAAPGLSPAPLTVLLAGNQEEDFFLIREILSRSKDSFSAELDHATSLDEVKTMLQRKACGLVLFEYATKDAAAVELLSQFLNGGSSVPFILLAENANERTVCRDHRIRHMELYGEVGIELINPVRTVRCALALHAMQQENLSTHDTLRKLSLGGHDYRPYRDGRFELISSPPENK